MRVGRAWWRQEASLHVFLKIDLKISSRLSSSEFKLATNMTVYLTVKTADLCKTTTSAATNTCPTGLKTWGFLQYLGMQKARFSTIKSIMPADMQETNGNINSSPELRTFLLYDSRLLLNAAPATRTESHLEQFTRRNASQHGEPSERSDAIWLWKLQRLFNWQRVYSHGHQDVEVGGRGPANQQHILLDRMDLTYDGQLYTNKQLLLLDCC